MNRLAIGLFLLVPALFTGCPGDGKGANSDYAVIVGGDGVFSPDYVKLAEGAAEGSYIITPYVNDTASPKIKAFSDAFSAKFKQAPDAWAALTYDAVGNMAHAIEASMGSGEPSREGVQKALAAMNSPETGYNGVTGVTFFDENGDCKKPAIIAEVKEGNLVKSTLQLSEGKADTEVVKGEGDGKKAEGKPILIGVAGPFTGQLQKFGEMIKSGATLRMEQINANGGIKGRPLTIKWGDDEGNNSKAANVANDFAADSALVAVVGHFNSTCSLAAKPVYRDAKIPAMSPGSTNVEVCKGSDYYFRNLYRDDFQGAIVADFISKKLAKKKVVVFYDNDDYGKGLKDFFVKQAEANGLEVLEVIEYNRESTTDYSPLVTKAKYKLPEVIFVAGLYNQAALIAKACKKAGVTK